MFVVIESKNQPNYIEKVTEFAEPENLRGIVDNIDQIMDRNLEAKRFMEEHKGGRPGHYYGRDVIIEGVVPEVAFYTAPNEFDGDPDWYQDDRKFQAYMDKHPAYSWLTRR